MSYANPARIGRPTRDSNNLTEAQLRKIEAKRRYDAERYRRLSNREKYGSVGHHLKVSKKAIAKRKSPGHSSVTHLMAHYKWNAIVKGVPFELTREQFTELISLNCNYCGDSPSSVIRGKNIWYPITYNGIDRVENGKGYVIGNVVPCCQVCNRAKRHMPLNDFLAWIEKLCAFRENRR